MVNFNKIKNGMAKYLDNEIIPNLSTNDTEKFLVGIVSGIFLKRMDKIMNYYLGGKIMKVAEITNEEDEIDIDLIYEVAKETIKSSSVSFEVPVLGKLTFTKDDIDSLYKYIIE